MLQYLTRSEAEALRALRAERRAKAAEKEIDAQARREAEAARLRAIIKASK